MPLPKSKAVSISDLEEMSDDQRVELIDGVVYAMASPGVLHQRIVRMLTIQIGSYIASKEGTCEVFPAPFDVQLDENDKYTLLQPDISVICDPRKIDNGKRCVGAPDWIIEVVSPSTRGRDYIYKLRKYQSAGVKEYWIIDPDNHKVMVYDFQAEDADMFDFSVPIKANTYPDLTIDLTKCVN